MYVLTGKRGVYTRKKGLDRETRKALLLKHIDDIRVDGSKLDDMYHVLPGHVRSQRQVLLRERKREGKIRVEGHTSAARWYPGSAGDHCAQTEFKKQ